jgi:hypothetical protein
MDAMEDDRGCREECRVSKLRGKTSRKTSRTFTPAVRTPSDTQASACTCRPIPLRLGSGTLPRTPRTLSSPDVGSLGSPLVLSGVDPSDIHAFRWIIRHSLSTKDVHRPLSASHSTPKPPPPSHLRRHAIPATSQGATHEALCAPSEITSHSFDFKPIPRAHQYTYGLSPKACFSSGVNSVPQV